MRIFVGSLALTTTEAELRQVFIHYGRVESVQILQDRETGRSRGFGFVEMPDATEAQAAIAGLNGRSLGERLLTVSEARQREERGRPQRPRQERRTSCAQRRDGHGYCGTVLPTDHPRRGR
jgi:RNA recognition motif-containing protein